MNRFLGGLIFNNIFQLFLLKYLLTFILYIFSGFFITPLSCRPHFLLLRAKN